MLFPELDENALYIQRTDPDELLSGFSPHSFKLDDAEWPSVEHYFQGMKFATTAPEHLERIRQAATPKQARKLGRSRFRKIRPDWAEIRRVIMTRALYTKCRQYPEVAKRLLDTGDQKIVESSQYDYFWGCGRDRRGENTYGKILMDVRAKLKDEESSTHSEAP